MRITRYSRGRPDYGGGYGRGSNGRYRGGRGRFIRDRRYGYDPNYQMFHRGRSYGYHSDRYEQSYRDHDDMRYNYHRYSSSPRQEDREGYTERRYGSPVELASRGSSVEEDTLTNKDFRKRRRHPAKHRDSRRHHRERSSSAALSDISSGSSFFGEVEDSDAYASPDYDELTSQATDEEEDADLDSQKPRDEIKRKKKKKEKKKRDKERRQRKKEKKRKKELLERICPPDVDINQSKEIFSSGKNILVSVSFPEADPDDEKAAERSHKKSKKKKSNRKKSKTDLKIKEERLRQSLEELIAYTASTQNKKRKVDENVKPVAIIDLERSPGKQLISSPKEVIVLSDDEATGKKKTKAPTDLVGPNTPPEPAPKSPASYDPFDPTKSSTQSPISGHNLGSISTVSYPDHHQHQYHGHYQHQRQTNDPHLSGLQTSIDLNSAIREKYEDGILDLHPSSPMDPMSPRTQYRQSPLKVHRSSPMKKPSGHVSATATITSGAMVAEACSGAPFGDDMDDGEISPYSPRSSDCDDHMFDPPSEGGGPSNANGSSGHTQPKTIALTVDNLRRVFGNDKNTLYGDLRRPNEAVALVDEMYKPQKVTMEMLDDIPNSAVDLQIKEKLIQKLQRQDRIVEEVKHFLKPHFNKKRINKDEYKDIMKKSIPKICHSRSGEINPLKIQNLITAYVKKAVAKRRIATAGGNAIVSSTTAVT
ncbi:uncharacterized protein LOC129717806 [Wyeomyia smithii]|uniref:uncharacterized protein LOC129717806 n=1 Tax=Wyeomyia smithii TaxID=174621 RepID=UPI002467D584|nr:uncharacterized protein LOC129717806 [Wyeomyia smithii]